MFVEQTPNPGSREALHKGCTCAVIDNHYGNGYRGKPGSFVTNENCPLHGRVMPKCS